MNITGGPNRSRSPLWLVSEHWWMKRLLLWYPSIQLNHSVLEDWIDVVENHSSQEFLITFCCWKCYGKGRKLLWLGHATLAWKSLSILFSPSRQKIKTSEQIYWGFSSLLVTLDSKSATGWRLVLLYGEEQLSLATPPCLMHWWPAYWSFLGDPALQISSAGIQQKGNQQKKSGTCSYGALAAEEQLPPLKAAPVTAVSQKSTFIWN